MTLQLQFLFNKKGEEFFIDESFDLSEDGLFETIGILESSNFSCKGSVKSYGKNLLLDLDYSVSILRGCDRCLEEYEENVSGNLSRTIVSSEDDADFECVIAENSSIDLHEIVCDELMIVLSAQSLCDYECKGLCSDCGINLNYDSCDCNKKHIDPRFSSLLEIDFD